MNIEILDSKFLTKDIAEEIIKGLEAEVFKTRLPTLYVKHARGGITFYAHTKGKEKWITKSDPRFYKMARVKYCRMFALVLRNHPCMKKSKDYIRHKQKLARLLEDFKQAKLDIRRITLPEEQYKWATAPYIQKSIYEDTRTYTTPGGVVVRSKSEEKIGTLLEEFGIPYRYEERHSFFVEPLVEEVSKVIMGVTDGYLFESEPGRPCHWKVPPTLEWMNNPGSIWKTYDSFTGEITIHPDFVIRLRDGSLLFWEHEGMSENPIYRVNAAERIFVLRTTDSVARSNLIYTFESDIQNPDALAEIIFKMILPRV